MLLLGNTSPQGSGVNGNSDTQVTNPSPTQLAISRGAITPAPAASTGFAISEFSAVTAWTFDPSLVGAALTPTAGTVYAMRMRAVLPTATNLACYIGATAGTLTTAQNFLSLVACSGDATRAAGVQVGITADQTANWGTAGVRSAAMTGGPFTVTVGAYYWLLMLMNYSVTGTTWGRNQNLFGALANFGMSATTNMRCATNVTAVSALPSPLVVASNVATGTEFWGAVT